MTDSAGATHLTLRAARAYLADCGVTMYELGLMVERGDVTGVTVKTESGHARVQLSIASLDAWKTKWLALRAGKAA